MPAWICVTCGVQQADTPELPPCCPVCEDERQYLGWDGQRWTTVTELARDHTSDLHEEETGLFGIGICPSFAAGQRALLVCTPRGNVLWDCVSLLDDAAFEEVTRRGGIAAVCLSHPHFYAACVEWADAFDAPIFISAADKDWIQRPSPRIQLWSDEEVTPVPGLTVIRIGGHFDGSAVLHWPAGAQGRGALLTSDTISVVQDRRWVSFMRSYPNLIPLDAATVTAIAQRVERYHFDRIYSGWWNRTIINDGPAAIRRSADRYIAHLTKPHPEPF
jgi:glyoxylase-like metal-dependent hydrolase (beta-lactamase superfamily II)